TDAWRNSLDHYQEFVIIVALDLKIEEIDTLVPIILAVQEDNDDAVSLMLELFDRDIDYEAKYGQRRIDPDLKQELQIKLIYITKHFDVQKHLAQRSQNLGQKKI
ncbi:helix-turn-helix domain-containing protein, partial [Lacticaseibacillus jixianensis]